MVDRILTPNSKVEAFFMNFVYAGVDLGVTSNHKTTVLNGMGKKIKSALSFGTSTKEYDAFINHCLSGQPSNITIKAICEPTGMAWFPLAQYLISRNHKVYRVKSEKVSDLRKYYKKHTKTDAIDSETLAKMPIVDEDSLYEVYLPDAKTHALDRKCKQREKITVSAASRKNRLRAIYSFSCPQLISCFKDPYSERARGFYSKYTNPFKVIKLGVPRLKKFLAKFTREKMDQALAQEIYDACLDAVHIYQQGNYIDFDELQEEVNVELRLLASEEAEIELLTSQINRLYEDLHPSDNLRTIPGIGPTLAPILLASIGDPTRFGNQREFKCFTGLIPGKDESGSSDRKGVKITKAGRRSLKRALYLAAEKGRQWDPELAKCYYDQMVHKGNCHTQAVCAVATKLASRIISVLKNDVPYQIRDLDGNPISMAQGREIIQATLKVTEEVRKRKRSRKVVENKKEDHDKGCSRAS